jgi:hypothetical protein
MLDLESKGELNFRSRVQGGNAIPLGRQNGVAPDDSDADAVDMIPLHRLSDGATDERRQSPVLDIGAHW